MQIAKLRALLPTHIDVDALLADFQRKHPKGDAAAFAIHLQHQGILSPAQLQEWLTNGDIQLGGVIKKGGGSRHQLVSVLGRGAMGEVYVARDPELNRSVAVKVLDPRRAAEAADLRRFMHEVQVTAQLDHPGIVPVYGLDTREDGRIGYSMRIVRGRTLREYLTAAHLFYERKQRPDVRHALPARLTIFLEMCNAIQYAHSRGVIHRDLKPPNIMIGEFGEVIVMDWGIAKVVNQDDEPGTGSSYGGHHDVTLDGEALGTPTYMSPEQAQGKNKQIDARTDQFALGLILFEMLTMERAYSGKNIAHLLLRASTGDKNPFKHKFGDFIPRELKAIAQKATQVDPDRRYPTVEAMAEDVRRFLRDEEVSAAPDGFTQRIARWMARHRQGMLTAFVLIVAGFVAFGATAVAGMVLAYRWVEEQSVQREIRLTRTLSDVTAHAHELDAMFLRYAGLLENLSGAAAIALNGPPSTEPVFFAEDFADPTKAPSDLSESKAYGVPASFEPDIVLAPRVEKETHKREIGQLASLEGHLHRTLLRGYADNGPALPLDAQRKLLFDDGLATVWSYVSTESGIMTAMPGTGEYPEDYDPRRQAWYRKAVTRPGLQWEASLDESGQGMLLTVSSAVRDGDNRLLGVAGLDISVRHITEKFLTPPGLEDVTARLVDTNQRVVAGPAEELQKPFLYPEVTDAVLAGEIAGQRTINGELVIWNQLQSVEWLYVVSGPEAALLGG